MTLTAPSKVLVGDAFLVTFRVTDSDLRLEWGYGFNAEASAGLVFEKIAANTCDGRVDAS